jgi:hypothetical protein
LGDVAHVLASAKTADQSPPAGPPQTVQDEEARMPHTAEPDSLDTLDTLEFVDSPG